jgi:hypothetical protein
MSVITVPAGLSVNRILPDGGRVEVAVIIHQSLP